MNIVNIEDGYCKRIQSYLDSYLNNELLVETNHEVLKHLETCEACSRSIEDRARLKDQLKRAVMQDYAPVALRERISGNLQRRRGFKLGGFSLVLAATAVALLVIALTVPFSFNSKKNGLSLRAELAPGDVTGQLLEIGFDDHVNCAIDHKMASRQFTVEQMSEGLGPEYAGLVELVKKCMPQEYTVAIGHRCHYQGREFIHLILRDHEVVVSLIITRKNGESFSSHGAEQALQAGGSPIYERSMQNLQVAGLETGDYLAFVVSNKTKEDTVQIASELAQPVRDFLKKLEA